MEANDSFSVDPVRARLVTLSFICNLTSTNGSSWPAKRLRFDLTTSRWYFLCEVLSKCVLTFLISGFFYSCKRKVGNPRHDSDWGMLSQSCPKASGEQKVRKTSGSLPRGRDRELSLNETSQWLGSCWKEWVMSKKLSDKYPMSQLMAK